MTGGYLALVLHAHLPYIRHPEDPGIMEERWLFEAITECYVPLIMAFEKLVKDGVNFKITLSLSPPLVTMLNDHLLQERYLRHLKRLISLAEAEIARNEKSPAFRNVAEMYFNRLNELRRSFEDDYEGNLILPIQSLQALGVLEVITTCATHGYLPLIMTREARRSQVQLAVEQYGRFFGRLPAGIWLPECAYVPGVDEILKEFGLRYFFVETHGINLASPVSRYGVYAPVFCRSGVAAFGRDPESSRQVWDRHTGYPGNPFYREFYRDIGYDLDLDYLAPYLPGGNIRCDTGLKYFRITGRGDYKEPYQPDIAGLKAVEDAVDFAGKRGQQVRQLAEWMDRKPIIVAPYDAELFGHWWYEGPIWLENLCRAVDSGRDGIRMSTPAGYLGEYVENQVVDLAASSWGEGGYNEVWLNPSNDWIYRHLHRAETTMVDLADLYPNASGAVRRTLNQAARELLLAQSSDWAFIIKTGTAVQYAVQRTSEHINHFNSLTSSLVDGQVNEEELANYERQDSIFPDIDYNIYSRHYRLSRGSRSRGGLAGEPLKVLMLSWEFPPRTVGGLARHVYDLSRALARLGENVHVVTCPAAVASDYELVEGVHVHRVSQSGLTETDFMKWVQQLNRSMEILACSLMDHEACDLIHAHDWLVEEAATALSRSYRLPLVATIHATEYGRNRGIHNDLQRRIHNLEDRLANAAATVICCSNYMAEEITGLFGVARKKTHSIPNGVDPASLGVPRQLLPGEKEARGGDKTILFIGRLVPEKGVQVLLEALLHLLPQMPDVKLLVGGTGPYEGFLKDKANNPLLKDKVEFLGFVNEDQRNQHLKQSDVAVFPSLYEPFGIVALEAMAAQIPVIVSDTGGLSEVVSHGIDGYKVPPGNPGLLAYYIREVLVNPGLARDLTRRAWKKVLTVYDWQSIALDTLDVYREALAAKF
ncbi:1,4-alpha-glucan branching protein domain-containing protein [Pelotomaculum propionicicum]|uniref:1,4-alpha-glucan branching enzyme n=1 Tax=Pelotomaculum propionicicum TaxID=258475 RepID=A0A4Y7RXU4_9FIRM|nr:1,4-alpha-glucan branching protein domain-containing protein [Pelotomaculum propionicicum]TEB13117.1 1,4-alpha-glucan branching enzyme [Pelotomaculum propionicicum]